MAPVERGLAALCLDDDQAEAVGDHVVQLTGDPAALGRGRELRLLVAFPLDLGDVGAADPDAVAREPGDREDQRVRDRTGQTLVPGQSP